MSHFTGRMLVYNKSKPDVEKKNARLNNCRYLSVLRYLSFVAYHFSLSILLLFATFNFLFKTLHSAPKSFAVSAHVAQATQKDLGTTQMLPVSPEDIPS